MASQQSLTVEPCSTCVIKGGFNVKIGGSNRVKEITADNHVIVRFLVQRHFKRWLWPKDRREPRCEHMNNCHTFISMADKLRNIFDQLK